MADEIDELLVRAEDRLRATHWDWNRDESWRYGTDETDSGRHRGVMGGTH